MIKIIYKLAILALLILLSIMGWLLIKGKLSNLFGPSSIETTHDIILEKTKSLGNLELTSYQFKDIVEQKIVIDFLPDPKALLVVYGEARACIDLTKVDTAAITQTDDTVTITLPYPELCVYKIDHSKSKVYDSEYAFMNEALLFEEAFKAAEKKLKETALESGILETAKTNAELILKPLFESISDKKVILKFEKS